jgi:N-acetylmuramoyl-L-alanine amidase
MRVTKLLAVAAALLAALPLSAQQATESANPPPAVASPVTSDKLATNTSPQPPKAPAPKAHAPAPPIERKFVVLLDPAHGGADAGAKLTGQPADKSAEKDATLALAQRIRSALTARGIESRMTRDGDSSVSPSERAAQTTADAACITLHVTSTGSGVHVFSPLAQDSELTGTNFQQWNAAHGSPSPQSPALARLLASTIARSQVPVAFEPAADPVLDRAACPAVAIELGPLRSAYAGVSLPNDPSYQQQIANSVADAMVQWRNVRRTPEISAVTAKSSPRGIPHP